MAEYVRGCSDFFTVPKPPWRERKEAYLAGVREKPPALRLIVAADKLHNVRSMLSDLRREGNGLWERFVGKRDLTLWYHAEIVRALGEGWEHPIVDELNAAVTLTARGGESHFGRFAFGLVPFAVTCF